MIRKIVTIRGKLLALLADARSACAAYRTGACRQGVPDTGNRSHRQVRRTGRIGLGHARRARDTGHYLGLSIVCRMDGSGGVEVTAYFSSFPGTHHPVQLMVRSAGGQTYRFGPVVAGGAQAGFHSPQITEPEKAERFLRLALAPGSLVSNGYRSFRNRVSESRNREVLEAFLDCVNGRGR